MSVATEPSRPLKLRLLLFLYSNPNIAGCALALLGPALLFAGVIGPGWLTITAGLYAAGWAIGATSRQTAAIDRRIEETLSIGETVGALDALVSSVKPHLSDDMNVHLTNVRSSITEVLPKLVGAGSHDAQLFTVRETVFRYLPETLANYVALPPVFRTTQALADGKTAKSLLADQLALLDTQMREVVSNVASADAQALLANGAFLKARFQQPDFLVR